MPFNKPAKSAVSLVFGGVFPTSSAARLNGIQEVRGSTPLVSIPKSLENTTFSRLFHSVPGMSNN